MSSARASRTARCRPFPVLAANIYPLARAAEAYRAVLAGAPERVILDPDAVSDGGHARHTIGRGPRLRRARSRRQMRMLRLQGREAGPARTRSRSGGSAVARPFLPASGRRHDARRLRASKRCTWCWRARSWCSNGAQEATLRPLGFLPDRPGRGAAASATGRTGRRRSCSPCRCAPAGAKEGLCRQPSRLPTRHCQHYRKGNDRMSATLIKDAVVLTMRGGSDDVIRGDILILGIRSSKLSAAP